MANNRPVASVSGKQDWEWNRWQAERRARSSRHDRDDVSARRRPSRIDHRTPRRCADPNGCRALEQQLHQSEQHRHLLIGQYERVLAEKNRKLNAEDGGEPTTETLSAAVWNAIRWVISPRR